LNLKFIKKKENNKYPCLLATENSVFTQKINVCKFLANQFNTLNNLLNKPETNNLSLILKSFENEKSVPTTINSNGIKNNHQNKGLSRPNDTTTQNDPIV
jgi:hypothetical protein